MVTRNIDLQVKPGGSRHHLRFRQYETGERALVIRLTDDEETFVVPTGTPVELCFSRSDESGYSIPCEPEGDLLFADVVPDMTECPGKVVCAVLFPLDGEWVCTDEFSISIIREDDEDADTTDSA